MRVLGVQSTRMGGAPHVTLAACVFLAACNRTPTEPRVAEPAPTAVPTATPTPVPSATPTPSPTPTPTATPTPTPTPPGPSIRIRTKFECAPLGGCGFEIRPRLCSCAAGLPIQLYLNGQFTATLACGTSYDPVSPFYGNVLVTVRVGSTEVSANVFRTADPHCCSQVFVECAVP